MDKLILIDEIATFRKHIETFNKKYVKPPYLSGIKKKDRFLLNSFCLINDGNALGKYMIAAADLLVEKGVLKSAYAISINGADNKFDCFEYQNIQFVELDDFLAGAPTEKCGYLVSVDCDNVSGKQAWLEALPQIAEFAAKGKKNRITVSTLLPDYPAIPNGIESLAEREFSYYLEEQIKDKTPEQCFYIEIEKLCRKIVSNTFEGLNISRIDNLYGPDINPSHRFDLVGFVQKTFEIGKVVINKEDYENIFTCTYIQSAMRFAVRLLYMGRDGQVYNFASHTVSVADLKNIIHKDFGDKLAIESASVALTEKNYYCLNTLKTFLSGWNPKSIVTLENAIYQTVCNITGVHHNNRDNIAIYSGKLPRIKELEIMMLKDIDDICRRNGIKYFLCGGTMLGAVRYGHSIPWDDDLDIGMLRDDFNKFREACQRENKDIYNYSSHINKSGSHYIVDKVRLNGTYFSTKFSSIHEYPDGLFIDVLVYDHTTNIKWLANLQCQILFALSKAIELRWYNRPRKNYLYKHTILALPFMRLFPIDFYHWVYEKILTMFSHTKNPKYVIDSTGKLQRKGPFLAQGLEDVQYVDYDYGFKAPIPVDYTNYLTFDYGPNYLPEPPLSQRCAPHNFARIDLGEYIFETREKPIFRDVNVHGELFEEEV